MLLLHKQRNDRGIDGSAARSHDYSLKRCKSHRGIKALSVIDGCNGRAVSEMAGNNLKLLRLLSEDSSGSKSYITVARSVEAVAADTVFLVIFVRKRIHIRIVGHRLMEPGIKNSNLRNIAHDLLAGVDSGEVVGVMQRSELAAFLNRADNVFIYDNGA